jgi:triacylglycerol lipase
MEFIFFLILITVFVFFPVFTYILFWYETANSAYRKELDGISKGKTGSWLIRGAASCILSTLVTIFTYPLGFIKKLWRPLPGSSASSPPVILIHGLYHNASAWIRFRSTLRRAGYERVYAFNYSSFRSDFPEISRSLAQWMAGIGQDFPGEDVMLVGHSMGGLLAKAYAGREVITQGPAVRAIITLGTPFQGSKAVVLGIGRLARRLVWGGPLFQELEGRGVPSGVSCVAFHSPVDNLVLPAASLTPPSGWEEEWTDPVSHVAMLYHGPTLRQVLNRLNEAAAPPSA